VPAFAGTTLEEATRITAAYLCLSRHSLMVYLAIKNVREPSK